MDGVDRKIGVPLLCLALATLTLCAEASLAAFPGKPGPIAYSKVDFQDVAEGQVSGTGGLFTHGPRRRQAPRPLTTDLGDHTPSYSADGRFIVFVSDDEKARTSSIYVMRADGSERKEVTRDGRGGSDPAFFPNGQAIVFARVVEGDSHIFTIRLDGTGLRQLTSGPHDDHDPAVSPNGRSIAFASDRDRDGRRDRSDIFTMRADGSRLGVAIDGPRREEEPDFAPDGRRLAFISNRNRGRHVFVARLDGRRAKQLTTCRDFPLRCRSFSHPAFSPDGRHIVALSTGTRTSGIEVLRSDGRGSYASFDSAGTEEEGFGSRLGVPTWGPQPR
jgi:Tol biopolymer transport system component